MNRINLFIIFLCYLTVNEYSIANAYKVFHSNGEETILTLADEVVNIECNADMPMGYCGFVQPNGKRYSISDHKLNSGHCSIKVQANPNITGEWRCHIGGKMIGAEVMRRIQIRVVGHMAAIKKNVSGVHGKPLTLACATIEKLTPVRYCRWEPPNGQPFSIDGSVTYNDPILDRYFFPMNKSLDGGDCAVTIRKVKYEDVGTWTCGAGLHDGREYYDTIGLDVEGLYTMSNASVTGLTLGIIGILICLSMLGYAAWKRQRIMGTGRPNEEAEAHELERLPQRSPAGSPQRTPQLGRNIPRVIIESPSEASATSR